MVLSDLGEEVVRNSPSLAAARMACATDLPSNIRRIMAESGGCSERFMGHIVPAVGYSPSTAASSDCPGFSRPSRERAEYDARDDNGGVGLRDDRVRQADEQADQGA